MSGASETCGKKETLLSRFRRLRLASQSVKYKGVPPGTWRPELIVTDMKPNRRKAACRLLTSVGSGLRLLYQSVSSPLPKSPSGDCQIKSQSPTETGRGEKNLLLQWLEATACQACTAYGCRKTRLFFFRGLTERGRTSPACRGDIHLHAGESLTCIEGRHSPAYRGDVPPHTGRESLFGMTVFRFSRQKRYSPAGKYRDFLIYRCCVRRESAKA